MPAWRLIPFDPQDLEGVLAIENASFVQPWQVGAILAEQAHPDARLFVVKKTANPTSEVAAYVFLRHILEEVHVMKMAVAPRWRRQGLGTFALTQAVQRARQKGATQAVLEVRASNSAAVKLYTRTGFEIVGIRKRYYGPTGEDALVMSRSRKEDL